MGKILAQNETFKTSCSLQTTNLSVFREFDLALDLPHLFLVVPPAPVLVPPPPVPPGAVCAHSQELERLVASVDSILLSSVGFKGES